MTISWIMVLDFTPMFAITTGAWNYSFANRHAYTGADIGVDFASTSRPS